MPSRLMMAVGQFPVTAFIKRRLVPAMLIGFAVAASSLCHVQEKRMMREPVVNIGIPVTTSTVRL
jgi:hypothetical protein